MHVSRSYQASIFSHLIWSLFSLINTAIVEDSIVFDPLVEAQRALFVIWPVIRKLGRTGEMNLPTDSSPGFSNLFFKMHWTIVLIHYIYFAICLVSILS